ncbi:MAG: radical SAM protein [Candidatus Methanomethylicaceae archaeon]
MNFLLINPPIGKQRLPAYFPLGLGYVAQILLKEGHEVNVLDINAYRWSDDEVEQQLKNTEFEAVGITGMVTEFAAVRWLSRLIKGINPNAPIVLGGGLPTAFPQMVLERTQVDIAVVGEGEVTIKELAESLAEGSPLSKVKGIWYKKGGDICPTQPRELIQDLDMIPFPARHLFSMEQYTQNPVPYLRMFDQKVIPANMVTSRGCPYRCTYCFHGLWGYQFRARSADNVVAEMKLLHEEYGVTGIFFMDDTFVLDRERVLAICDKLIDEDLNIIWAASGRVNLMDPEMLERMRAAGCRAILYGIESGSQQILNEMRKGVTVEQARQAILNTWRAGILPVGYLMIGMFGETPQTVEETIRFCNETGLISGFSYATPFPGTDLYARAVESGKLQPEAADQLLERWTEWGDEVLVNLSNIPTDKLKLIKKKAERRILWEKWWRKAPLYIRTLGLLNFVREGFRFLKKQLRIGKFV